MNTDTPPDAAVKAPAGRRVRGGADARRAVRSHPKLVQLPYITRRIPLVTVLDEEGLTLIEGNADTILEEIGIEFRDDEEALQMWREAGADVKGTRVHFPARPAALPDPEDRAPGICPACPQSRAQCRHRRQPHGLRAGLWPALHPLAGRWAALRHHRGFPQFREARLYVAGDPSFRRHGLRARRSAGEQAPSRYGL